MQFTNPLVDDLTYMLETGFSEEAEDHLICQRRSGRYQLPSNPDLSAEFAYTVNFVAGSGYMTGNIEGQTFEVFVPLNQSVCMITDNERGHTSPATLKSAQEAMEEFYNDVLRRSDFFDRYQA